jgi:benzoyl-CoA reductase/2-hydroxyglutaryl-CoA dehydratase subunit BcrC/BadD/HgdB
LNLRASINKLLQARRDEILEAKTRGRMIIGHSVGEYIPQELIHAAGCIPVCLLRGGDPEPVALSGAYVPRFLCAFCRAQLGYRLSQDDFWYRVLDFFITAVTCQHIRRMGDLLVFYTGLEEFRFGVPRHYTSANSFSYYYEGLKELRHYLEERVGKKIQDSALWDVIKKYNRVRQTFRELCELRKKNPSRISAKDFISLQHASFFLDPAVMLDLLMEFYEEAGSECNAGTASKRPRVMLMGPNLAMGDYHVIELLKEYEIDIVIEDFCEGGRRYWKDVVEGDDEPLINLARFYYNENVPCCYMISAMETRYKHLTRLVEAFKVDGAVWYHLKFCETYSLEGYYLMRQFRQKGLPVMKITSEYDISQTGQLRTRIETFVKMLQG